MTANPKSQPQKPLRVVMPKARTVKSPSPRTSFPETVPSSSNLPDEPAAPKSESKPAWIRRGVILSGLAMAAFIPLPYQVGGNVTLEWTEGQRQAVYSPRRAIVQEIHVQSGDTISRGEPLVTLQSLELENEMATTKEKLAEAKIALEGWQVQRTEAEARALDATVLAQSAERQAQRLQDRIGELDAGKHPPELIALQTEANSLEKQLKDQRDILDKYSTLHEEGVVSEEEMLKPRMDHESLRGNLAVKQEEIKLMERQLREETDDQADTAIYQQTVADSNHRVAQASQKIAAYQETIQMLESRLADLQHQKDEFVVIANVPGRILGEDLDLMVNQEIQPSAVILRVANLKELTAHVEIKEDDLEHVRIGAPVKFRSQQAKLFVHDARIEAIPPSYAEPDETQQRRVVTVKLSIDNEDELLRPGSSGYAKVFSEWIPLYQHVGREISKLVPIRFL